MRDILFRGKRVDNGEWVDGYFLPFHGVKRLDGTEPYASIICNDTFDTQYRVLAETVGQFTGLRDKNGKRIFEGDIVDVEYDIQYVGVAAERIGLFEVVFHDGCFMKEKKSGGLFHFINSDKCQVIGTIYDNPELLEEL